MKILLAIIGILFFPILEVEAQSLEGTWGFRTYPSKKQICVYGDKISNDNSSGRTGTLKIALYASRRPYYGGTITGYCLFEKRFDPIKAGEYYYSINKLERLSSPPRGKYCVTILLLEYSGNIYQCQIPIDFKN